MLVSAMRSMNQMYIAVTAFLHLISNNGIILADVGPVTI